MLRDQGVLFDPQWDGRASGSEQKRSEQKRSEQERSDQNRSDQNRSEQNRSEQNHSEQNRSEQNRSEQNRSEQKRSEVEPLHEQIDHELRRIAKRKAGLEVEEARWLREAEKHRIWRKLGYSTVLEYLEDVFGYAPRTAKDRLRVARELGQLPQLERELRRGALSYSAARELSRVMTQDTEDAWLACARGRNVHDIQRLVEGHRKGDAPDAPKDPSLITRTFVFELDGRRAALLEQVRAMFEDERGEHLDSAQLMEAMCTRLLAVGGADSLAGNADMGSGTAGSVGNADVGSGTVRSVGDADVEGGTVRSVGDADVEVGGHAAGRQVEASDVCASRGSTSRTRTPSLVKAARPAHQIMIRRCDDCSRAWQQGRGSLLPITAADLELVSCDAEIVREDELVAAETAGRRRPQPTTTIPAKTRDLVMARDEGRCRFPGCRATRHVSIHHIRHRAHGGDHDPSNLAVLCDGHHKLLHDGIVSITGRAPDELVFMRNGTRLADPRAPESVTAARALHRRSMMDGCATGGRRPRDSGTCGVASRYDEVVAREHATQALKQLGYKAREARQAIEQARAHVGTAADVATIVQTVLAISRSDGGRLRPSPGAEDNGRNVNEAETVRITKQALVQLGFERATAERAVSTARAHVSTDCSLELFIKESLRHC